MAKLLLWDIDGTLISVHGAGAAALCQAMKVAFGIDADMDGIELGGRTDSMICRVFFDKYGVDMAERNVHDFFEAYLQSLRQQLVEKDGIGHPGTLEILEQARQREDLVQGLLTGNLARGARSKLEHFRIWHYFEFGAFGDYHHDRNKLGPVALEEAFKASGVEFRPEDVFVIGDTPHDIACGKAIEAKTIAVATGASAFETLASNEPTALFRDLSDTAAFFRVVDG